MLGIQKYSLLPLKQIYRLTNFFYSCYTGEGQFGKVYACANLDTGELMAVKQVQVVRFNLSIHCHLKFC